MARSPEQCRHRAPLDDGAGAALCGMVARVTGAADPGLARVGRDACEACCRSLLPAEDLNPAVASLVFNAAGAILRAGGVPGCDPGRATAIRRRVVNHLGVVHPGMADRAFPPESAPAPAAAAPGRPGLTWAVGVMTAPRRVPTLARTLRDLDAAGFGPVRLFAEPGSWLPPEADGHLVEVRPNRLGNFTNFYDAFASLYRLHPEAECIALFQDDVAVAAGLKGWCDGQLWPLGAGLVSLFTPRVHAAGRPGWELKAPGYYRIFGGQAFVVRRDVLEGFLADPHVLREIRVDRYGDDAILAGWAFRHGHPIAYHTPSPVQHIGVVSSLFGGGPEPRTFADAVAHVDQIATWRPPERRKARIGLVGWDSRTGLGYQNSDLARRLGVDRWLVPDHPYCPDLIASRPGCRVERLPAGSGPGPVAKWMRGLDWIVFIEQPFVAGLLQVARRMVSNIACVANWEWLNPEAHWVSLVDLMICPTRHTHAFASDCKRRYGFGWEVAHVPWPVDTRRFRFRPRRECRRFVFVNGWGGGPPQRLDGSTAGYGRKGLELVAEAARLAPHIPWIVYSQARNLPALPPNVELRPPPRDNRRLYVEGDVCVQPSHFEGLGLPLLECQAAGMPLVTTDAPPMNEYEPLATVPTSGFEVVQFRRSHPFPSQWVRPDDLARVLDGLLGADVAEASRRARAFVEREHSWNRALPMLRERLVAY